MIVEGMLFPRSYLIGPPEPDEREEARQEAIEMGEYAACFEEDAPLYLAGLGDSPVVAEDFAPLGYVPTDDDLPF
jgi:hypothetical protein